MTTFCLLTIPRNTVPVALPRALFQVRQPSNSNRQAIHATSIEDDNLIFHSLRNHNN